MFENSSGTRYLKCCFHIDKGSSFNRAHKPHSYVLEIVFIYPFHICELFQNRGVALTSYVLRVHFVATEHFAETPN